MKPMKDPLGVSLSRGNQGTTRDKEKIILTSLGIEPTTSLNSLLSNNPVFLEGYFVRVDYRWDYRWAGAGELGTRTKMAARWLPKRRRFFRGISNTPFTPTKHV